MILWGGAVSYERGTPVQLQAVEERCKWAVEIGGVKWGGGVGDGSWAEAP